MGSNLRASSKTNEQRDNNKLLIQEKKLDLPPRVEGKNVVKRQLSVNMSCQWVLLEKDASFFFYFVLSFINND
jgi:hypothetical protein